MLSPDDVRPTSWPWVVGVILAVALLIYHEARRGGPVRPLDLPRVAPGDEIPMPDENNGQIEPQSR